MVLRMINRSWWPLVFFAHICFAQVQPLVPSGTVMGNSSGSPAPPSALTVLPNSVGGVANVLAYGAYGDTVYGHATITAVASSCNVTWSNGPKSAYIGANVV